MWRKVAVVAAALALAGSTLVYAQHAGRDGGRQGGFGPHWRSTAADIGAFTDARVAGLKAGLKLTAEQEANWPAFEQAMRELGQLRAARRTAWLDREHTWFDRDRSDRADRADSGAVRETPIDRLQRRADMLSRNGAALKKLADAAAPLYASLDDAQKQRFLVLARDIAPRHPRFAAADRASEKSDRMDQEAPSFVR